MSSTADYEALDRLEAETANIAAGGRWLLAADRIADLMQFFNDVPFFDVYAAPVTTLQEIGGIAGGAVEHTDVAGLTGIRATRVGSHPCPPICVGDLARFDHLTDLARGSRSAANRRRRHCILESMAAGFDG